MGSGGCAGGFYEVRPPLTALFRAGTELQEAASGPQEADEGDCAVQVPRQGSAAPAEGET